MEKKHLKDIDIEDIFCKDGLYIKYFFDEDDDEQVDKILKIIVAELKLDFYCINCNEERLFQSVYTKGYKFNTPIICRDYGTQNAKNLFPSDKNFTKAFNCSYCEQDKVVFHFRIEDNYLMKVGQFPSLADLTREDTKKYRKILSEDDYSDLNRAIGLNSHGVGAGSLIYLRRVFENLIKKAYDNSIQEDKWNKEEDFYRITMEQKIKNLKDYLPKFVVEHHYIYGILSKGIHELSEQDCLNYFDLLKESIFIILDEEIRRVEEEKRKVNLSKVLNKINSEIREKK